MDTKDIKSPMEYTGYSIGPEFGDEDAVSYRSESRIAIITINRALHPTFDEPVVKRLRDAWIAFECSSDLVALLLGVGMDVSKIPIPPDPTSWRRAEDVWWCFPNIGTKVSKPVVIALDQSVIGSGLGLTIFSDIAIAADRATFSYPEAKVGVAGGVAASLAARIPHKIALEILVVGDAVSAQRAYEVGLVNQVVPAESLVEAAMAVARKIAGNAPRVVAMMKKFADATVVQSPAEIAAQARSTVIDVVYSEDRKEGFRSLNERRLPVFTGD